MAAGAGLSHPLNAGHAGKAAVEEAHESMSAKAMEGDTD